MANHTSKFLVAALAMMVACATQAAGDPAAGRAKSATCAACHGPDGNSVSPSFPRLAGQNEDYIQHALSSYQNGSRNNPIMKGMAQPLSKQDVADLAAYFSSRNGLVVKR